MGDEHATERLFSPPLPVCPCLIGFVTHGRKSQGLKMIERSFCASTDASVAILGGFT